MLQTVETDNTRAASSRPWFAREAAAMLALSWPLIVANVAQSAMTTTDLMMLGWLSPKALAAGALGYNLFLPLLLFGIGLIGAAAPIVASLVGANADDVAGPRLAAHQAFISAIAVALPMWALLWNAQSILIAFGQEPDLAAQAAIYLHGLQWALAPAFLFFAARSVFSALNRTGPTLLAGVLAVGVNAAANYLLIFGKLGLPALGIFGSGLATFLSQCFMLLVLISYAFIDPHLARYRLFSSVWRIDWRKLGQLWRLGAPIGLTITFEITIFAASVFLMGLIGAAALEAHAVVFQIVSLAFMIPLGLSQAATVRVGHAFGACDRVNVSRSGWTALTIGLGFMVLSASTMLLFPKFLLSGFIDVDAPANAETVERAGAFLRVAALFQIFDGAQAVAAGMLRGVHDARAPMLIALFGYWGIGLPVGALLAFETSLAGVGLWIGLACGLACVSVLLLVRWRLREKAGFFKEAVS
ncbi:MATE family efflux transporter [Methylocapsa sp. S129]|uniref:MATE family efflux transporter n=1 Tax=Methylocapsa sp. S129 TaxID=1641869 RepID=UPI001FED35F6|nr:MATE family efflux transporter [Methylocapsa sp. S129]